MSFTSRQLKRVNLILSHEVKVTYFKLLPFTHRMNEYIHECNYLKSFLCETHEKTTVVFAGFFHLCVELFPG